jgi:hypothetical protein
VTTVVVDAENVRRSVWPNVSRDELVELCGRLAHEDALDVFVVFDGALVAVTAPERVRLVGEPGRSADDLIVELAATVAPDSTVATSDRGLRSRLRPTGVSTVGGGTFVRDLVRRRETPSD